MKTYTILKNGYAIGQAKGKRNAVERIKLEIGEIPTRWSNPAGMIVAYTQEKDRYVVEEQHN